MSGISRDVSGREIYQLNYTTGIIPSPTRTTYIPFGDSYVAASGTQEYSTGSTRQQGAISFWLEALLGGRLRPIRNAGVNGNSTSQMLARIQADVLAYSPNIVLLLTPGINDIQGQATPDVTALQSNLTSIFDQLRNAGILCVTITVPPTVNMTSTAQKQALFTHNRWLLDQASARAGLIVVDPFTAISDTASLAWRSGYSDDGIHPNGNGSFAVATKLAVALDKLLPSTGSLIGKSNLDPYEIMPNARMNGNTAGVATSVTITGGTGTASKVARTDTNGEWQKWVNTSGTNFILQLNSTGFSVGDTVVGRMELYVEAPYTTTSSYIEMQARTGANALITPSIVQYLAGSTDAPVFGSSSSPVIIQTNPFVVPATAVYMRIQHVMTGAGTIYIGAMSIRKVGV